MAPRIKSSSYIFAVINKPVDFKIPYLVGSYLSTPLLEELYDQQHYENNPYLTKRQLEKLWIMPATGPRYSILKIPVPSSALALDGIAVESRSTVPDASTQHPVNHHELR